MKGETYMLAEKNNEERWKGGKAADARVVRVTVARD
jgi:hypothetical protein